MAHRIRNLARWRALAVLALAVSTVAVGLSMTTANAQTLSVDAPADVGAEVGNKFCVNLDVDGASDPANLSFAAVPALPGGLSIGSYEFGEVDPETRHAISGTPPATAVGSSSHDITVTDDLGTVDTADDVQASVTMTIDVIDPAAADAVIAAGRISRGYTIDCDSQAREVQGLLRDLSNFGDGGTVDQRIAVEDSVSTIDTSYLLGVDVLVDGWVFDAGAESFSTAELDDIEDWVEGGGVLIAAEDRPDADALADRFGAPIPGGFFDATLGNGLCDHTPSELDDPIETCPTFSAASSTHPIVSGPFGDWSALPLNTSGSYGQFGSAPAGWTVIATNAQGNATVISRRVEAGRVILLSDEGLLRTESYGGSNETFVANLFAYALNAFEAPDLVDDTVAGTTGEALSADLCANDTSTGDPVITVTISGRPLPIGLELDGCTVAGTPTTPGDSQVTYRVTDGDGDTDTATAAFSIAAGADLPTCRGETATIVGTAGPDTLVGTDDRDVIVGLGGADTIRGGLGDDLICGGGGNDTLRGDRDDDVLFGQGGNDTVIGDRGNDRAAGNRGDDVVRGRRGADVLNGNSGDDRLTGNRGRDLVRGGAGTDVVKGNVGNDRLAGNAGPRDRCLGGRGIDTFLNGCEIRRG